MHLDEEQVQRLVHAELTPAAESAARDHLGGCADCRARVTVAEDEEAWVAERLRELDHPPARVVGAETIAAVATRRASVRAPNWGRWAAGILLVAAAAGGAYAAIRVIRAGDRVSPDTTVPAPPTVSRGVALPPGERLTIDFAAEQPQSVATVTLTAGTEVAVRAVDGVATFTSDPDRLSIDNARSSARYEIEIPSTAREVRIRVGGGEIFAMEGRRVVTGAPRGPDGRYVIPLVRPNR